MKVTSDLSVSGFTNLYNQVQTDYLKLNSLRSDYGASASTATTNLGRADFSGWEDSVSTTMQLGVEDFSKSVSAITEDLSSGNYSIIITKMNDLMTELDKCKSAKNTINNKEYQLNRTTRYVEGTNEETNDYKTLSYQIRQKKKDLNTSVDVCNSLIEYMEGLEFAVSSEYTAPAGGESDFSEEEYLDDGAAETAEETAPSGLPDDSINFSQVLREAQFNEGTDIELSDGSELIVNELIINEDGTRTAVGVIISADGNEYEFTFTQDAPSGTETGRVIYVFEVTYDGQPAYTIDATYPPSQFGGSGVVITTDNATGDITIEHTRGSNTETVTLSQSDPSQFTYTDTLADGDKNRSSDGSGDAEMVNIVVQRADGTSDTYTVPGGDNGCAQEVAAILAQREYYDSGGGGDALPVDFEAVDSFEVPGGSVVSIVPIDQD